MTLPPLWKISRELERIADKPVRLVGRWVHDPIRNTIYDLTSDRRQQVTQGRQHLTDRVAVFVVFQPKGVAASVLLTLEHLQQNGYSVLVVSNGPLCPKDRQVLAEHAAIVLERPNIGYDFGAYRDGIQHLWSLRVDLSRLILMNDSTWFPLRRDDDSLFRMEALGADLAGHIFKTESAEKPENDHLESHLLMISADFLRSADFGRFWSRYRMSDNRATTIAQGEKAFSQLAIHRGYRVESLMGREWLLSVLRQLSDRDLRLVLDHTIDSFGSRQKDASSVRRLAASGAPWRDAYLDWVDTSLRNSLSLLISGTFVMPALVYGRMGFSKKAKDIRFHMAREELLDLEASGRIPPLCDVVRAEVRQAVQTWVPPKGQEKMARPAKAVANYRG